MHTAVHKTIAAFIAAGSLVASPPALAASSTNPLRHGTADANPLKNEAILIGGTVTAINGSTLTVEVEKANAKGRSYVGHDVAVEGSAARVVVRDVDRDGSTGLDEVTVSDEVVVGSTDSSDHPGSLHADIVVDRGPTGPRLGGPASAPPLPAICRYVDGGAALSRLTPAQRDAIHTACEALGLGLTEAASSFSATVERLRGQVKSAQAQLETACQQARVTRDPELCISAEHVFQATIQDLREQFKTAQSAERAAFRTALDQFRATVRAVVGGSGPGAPAAPQREPGRR